MGEELEVGWHGLRLSRGWRRRSRRGPALVEKVHQEAGARDAIGNRVVHPQREADAPTFKPLDDPNLPERLGTVEWRAADAANHGAELLRTSRGRKRDAVHVADHVEIGIVNPQWMLQIERNPHEPSTKHAVA